MKKQDLLEECAICGSKNIRKLTDQSLDVSFKTASKVKKFTLSGLSFEKCLDCEEIYFSWEDIEIKEQKLNEALESGRKKKGLLTAQEIKEIRATLGYSQDQLDKLLGFGARSFARWETYRADQSKAADLLLRALKSGGDSLLKIIISEQKTKDAA
jgi:putative zinc finger/helix-turn-helix YgiT family protein